MARVGVHRQGRTTRYAARSRRPLRDSARDLSRALRLVFRSVGWGGRIAARWALRRELDPDEVGRRLRGFLEGGGVAFVKLGQYLAIRVDLLPAEVCRELSKLFGDVAPARFDRVKTSIEAEFGKPLDEVFARFDVVPFAAASMAQVHRAVTHDGEEVAVKVLRPGLEETLLSDLRNLRRLAAVGDRLSFFDQIRLSPLVEEFAEYTLRETDMLQEGKTAERVGVASSPMGTTPEIRWDLTTSRILTMEFIQGVPLSKIAAAADSGEPDPFARLLPGVDGADVMNDLADACLTQLFVDGYFHGDPHPANILIRSDGRVVFVDFGIVGSLSDEERRRVADYVGNLASGRLDTAYRHYLRLIEPSPHTDSRSFRRETIAIMHRWRESSRNPASPTSERITARYQGEIFDAMRRHSIRMRSNQLLFWRALAVLDATAQRIPGTFNLLEKIAGFFRSFFLDEFLEELCSPRGPLPIRGGAAPIASWGSEAASSGATKVRVHARPHPRGRTASTYPAVALLGLSAALAVTVPGATGLGLGAVLVGLALAISRVGRS